MYFALHNNDNRAVLNRMKVNQVHVWQDAWGAGNRICANFLVKRQCGIPTGRKQPITKEGCKLEGVEDINSKLLNSRLKAQFGVGVIQGQCEGGWRSKELSNVVGPLHPVGSFTGQAGTAKKRPSAQTIGKWDTS